MSHCCNLLQHMVQLGQSTGVSKSEGLPQSAMKLDSFIPFEARIGTVPRNRFPWRCIISSFDKFKRPGGMLPVREL
eukprot:5428291-Ditylum_brightwellii.AAC.1